MARKPSRTKATMPTNKPSVDLDLTKSQSMQELDPSPVEETPSNVSTSIDEEEKSYFPPASSRASTTSTLGLASSRVPHILLALQKYSTIPPAIYLTMHITNTALIPLLTRSVTASDKYLLLTRPYYQSFPFESLLIFAPIATHVLSGISLRIYRRRQNAKRHGAESHSDRRKIPWPKFSLTSALGYALEPMLAAHVFVNRILPLKHDGGSSGVGLRYFAHGMSKHPVLLHTAYATMLAVASWHFVTGASKWLGLSSEYVTERGEDGVQEKRRRKWGVNAVAALLWGVWVAGGLGVVGRGGRGSGWEARAWDDLYLRVPLIGSWL